MKKCVITGAAGYVGSHLTRRLLKEGYEVSIIIKQGLGMNAINDIKDQLNIYEYDNDLIGLILFLKGIGNIDVVFHLASCVLTNHGIEDLDNLLSSNIIFGTHMLEAMKACNCRSIINTGTYWQHYNNEEYNPVDLYAATKEAFEKIIDYYVQVEKFKAITLELFDNYGPNDDRRKLMNLLRDVALSNKQLEMTPGNQIIDLTYIDDLVEGYIMAANLIEGNVEHDKYMLSSKERITLRELVRVFQEVVGKKLDIKFGGREYKQREIMIPWDNGINLPNWEPKTSLTEGISNILQEIK